MEKTTKEPETTMEMLLAKDREIKILKIAISIAEFFSKKGLFLEANEIKKLANSILEEIEKK